MVNFGGKLDEALYEPWREYYVQYDKLKRIITRNRFILDSRRSKNIDPALTSLSRSRSNSLVRTNSKLLYISGGSPPLSREPSKVNYSSTEVELGSHGITQRQQDDSQASQMPTEETPLTGRIARSNTMLDLIKGGFDVNNPNPETYELEVTIKLIKS